ncbi:multidrug efflux SMR transporter [Gemella sp. zg-1178]|uniref:DMT family transporter n=1 Tax=Gemella sp. zg-1178 TaxID=2840372 RepID=UPI001C055DA1|nr:multidrug efflux SMR transporter [Gemella sp. zg-1178]MBU0278619.1 multidrug efflux SMR transporter [Gemella sp. zg-1178]
MHYLYLFIAILIELFASSMLKLSEGFTKFYPALSSIIGFAICFYFLALSLNKINLGVAYATWSAVGIVFTSIISVLIFKESINVTTILGIILIVVGVIIVNLFGNAGH